MEGGTWGVDKPYAPDGLYGAVTVRTGQRAKAGYFLRGETHAQVSQFGGSHGESVMELTSRFIPQALYLMDEPESGLSAVSQMALLSQLHTLAASGAQVIAVTHSPILLGIPGADIIEISEESVSRGVSVEDTTAFRAMRDFLADPRGVAEHMANWADMWITR